jgi:CRP-like cAMP-binding protein
MSDAARFALHRPELFDSLVEGERKVRKLLDGSAQKMLAGQVLIKGDTEHSFVYRLVSGWACRTRRLADGRDQFILIFLPGDLFAVKSMFVTRHTDDVMILSDAIVEKIHQKELHRAYLADADVAMRCTWQVVEEERRLHNWVVSLGQGSADERLAALLIDFRGRLALSRTIQPDDMTFAMPLTQSQLADHIGITPIHVNRVLKVFRESGIVTIRDGTVAIHDMQRLAKLAYPLLDAYERSKPEYTSTAENPSVSKERRHTHG